MVNDTNYSLDGKGKFSKLIAYKRDKLYEMVEGEHTFYDDITLNRKLFFIFPNVIVIQDSGSGTDIKTLTQNYNLGENAKNVKIRNNIVTANFDDKLNIEVKTANINDKAEIHDFYRSVAPYRLTDTKQIKLKTNNNSITTIINLVSSEYQDPVENVYVKNDMIIFTKGQKKYNIKM